MFSCNPTSELKSFAVNEITQSHFKGNFKEIVQQPLLLNISHTTLQYQIRVGTTTALKQREIPEDAQGTFPGFQGLELGRNLLRCKMTSKDNLKQFLLLSKICFKHQQPYLYITK